MLVIVPLVKYEIFRSVLEGGNNISKEVNQGKKLFLDIVKEMEKSYSVITADNFFKSLNLKEIEKQQFNTFRQNEKKSQITTYRVRLN